MDQITPLQILKSFGVNLCLLQCNHGLMDRRGRRSLQGEWQHPYEKSALPVFFFYGEGGIYEPIADVVTSFHSFLFPSATANLRFAGFCILMFSIKTKKTGFACLLYFYGEGGIYEPIADVVLSLLSFSRPSALANLRFAGFCILMFSIKTKKTGFACLLYFYGEGGI